MDEAQFLEIVTEILELEDGEVAMESGLEDLDWDSLSNLSFIAVVDERVGKTVSPEALKACTTVADLYALV